MKHPCTRTPKTSNRYLESIKLPIEQKDRNNNQLIYAHCLPTRRTPKNPRSVVVLKTNKNNNINNNHDTHKIAKTTQTTSGTASTNLLERKTTTLSSSCASLPPPWAETTQCLSVFFLWSCNNNHSKTTRQSVRKVYRTLDARVRNEFVSSDRIQPLCVCVFVVPITTRTTKDVNSSVFFLLVWGETINNNRYQPQGK